jgi:hypothetical protein
LVAVAPKSRISFALKIHFGPFRWATFLEEKSRKARNSAVPHTCHAANNHEWRFHCRSAARLVWQLHQAKCCGCKECRRIRSGLGSKSLNNCPPVRWMRHCEDCQHGARTGPDRATCLASATVGQPTGRSREATASLRNRQLVVGAAWHSCEKHQFPGRVVVGVWQRSARRRPRCPLPKARPGP